MKPIEANAIIAVINEFLKKKGKNYEDLAQLYFGPGADSTLDKAAYVNKTMEVNMGISAQQADDLFEYIDSN